MIENPVKSLFDIIVDEKLQLLLIQHQVLVVSPPEVEPPRSSVHEAAHVLKTVVTP